MICHTKSDRRRAEASAYIRRPETSLITIMTTAITNRIWMNPLIVTLDICPGP